MRTASTDTPDSDVQDKEERIRERDRNFRLAMLQGTFMRMSFALVDAATILPAFVHTLTQSKILVGLTGSLPQQLTGLSLRTFHWNGTDLCSPDNEDFQDWLAGIHDNRGEGKCG